MTMSCDGCSWEHFKARLAANFQAGTDPVFVVSASSEDLVPTRFGRNVKIAFNNARFWEGAATIASKLQLDISPLSFIDGGMEFTVFGEGLFRHWQVVGPVLLDAQLPTTSDLEGTQGEHDSDSASRSVTIRPLCFDCETDQLDIRLHKLLMIGTDGREYKLAARRRATGSWAVEIPTIESEIREIRGELLAAVASDLYRVSIRPGGDCEESSIGLRARCAPVQKSPSIATEGFHYSPADGFTHVYHTTAELTWSNGVTVEQMRSIEKLTIDDEPDVDTGQFAKLRAVLNDQVFLEFINSRNGTPSLRILQESREVFADDLDLAVRGAGGLGAPQYGAATVPVNAESSTPANSITVTLFSEHKDKVETFHDLLLRRVSLINTPFAIKMRDEEE
ncbi:MAG: hypothetical protein KF861_19860 [Planctomycetaceae bacterium]|nr:hypothetical protein [Planctomycetaceae bacterium]